MFSRDADAANITVSCGTSAMRARSSAGSASRQTARRRSVTLPDDRIVEPQDQMEDRALAGAGRPDDRDLLARRARETTRRRAPAHPAAPDRRNRTSSKCDLAARRHRQRLRLRRRLDLRLDGQNLEQPLGRAGRLRDLAPHLPQFAEPAGGEHRVEHELPEPARRHACPPAHPARRPTAPRRRWRTPERSRPRSACARAAVDARGGVSALDRARRSATAPAVSLV